MHHNINPTDSYFAHGRWRNGHVSNAVAQFAGMRVIEINVSSLAQVRAEHSMEEKS
jgi:hypothetical protein